MWALQVFAYFLMVVCIFAFFLAVVDFLCGRRW